MVYKLTDLNSWPSSLNGAPIFNNTEEALLYAQLIYDKQYYQDRLITFRQGTLIALKKHREEKDPDFDIMMVLATRAQFFRECLDECQRIKDEKYNTPGD